MSALPLAQVCDTDCIRSTSPLVLGRMPGKYVYGANAVLRRVLYRWLLPRGVLRTYDTSFGESLLLAEGKTFTPRQILALRSRLEFAARDEDYVLRADVPVSLDSSGVLSVPGSIWLVDGKAYPLEVAVSGADVALRALGV